MKLELYKKDVCPYCIKVMNFIDENNIKDKIEYKDIIENPDYRNYLREVGGQNMVPCLFIDGKAMYESNDIIAWLKENVVGQK